MGGGGRRGLYRRGRAGRGVVWGGGGGARAAAAGVPRVPPTRPLSHCCLGVGKGCWATVAGVLLGRWAWCGASVLSFLSLSVAHPREAGAAGEDVRTAGRAAGGSPAGRPTPSCGHKHGCSFPLLTPPGVVRRQSKSNVGPPTTGKHPRFRSGTRPRWCPLQQGLKTTHTRPCKTIEKKSSQGHGPSVVFQ